MAKITGTKPGAHGPRVGGGLMLKLSFSYITWRWMYLQIGTVMQLDIKRFNWHAREPGEDWKCLNRKEKKIALCLSLWGQNPKAKGLTFPKETIFERTVEDASASYVGITTSK